MIIVIYIRDHLFDKFVIYFLINLLFYKYLYVIYFYEHFMLNYEFMLYIIMIIFLVTCA